MKKLLTGVIVAILAASFTCQPYLFKAKWYQIQWMEITHTLKQWILIMRNHIQALLSQ